MSATESFTGLQAAAGSSTGFVIRGGRYAFVANATGTPGTVALERLGPDGTNYVGTITAIAAVTGFVVAELPAGTYRVTTATFTDVYWELDRIVN